MRMDFIVTGEMITYEMTIVDRWFDILANTNRYIRSWQFQKENTITRHFEKGETMDLTYMNATGIPRQGSVAWYISGDPSIQHCSTRL